MIVEKIFMMHNKAYETKYKPIMISMGHKIKIHQVKQIRPAENLLCKNNS